MLRFLTLSCLLTLLAGGLFVSLRAHEADAPDPAPATQPADDLEGWRDALDPKHDVLKRFVGEFDTRIRYRPTPADEWTVTDGTDKNQITFGGRFLQGISIDLNEGDPIISLGLLGYNTDSEHFEFFAIDDATNAMSLETEGVWDDEKKSITFKSDDYVFVLRLTRDGYVAESSTTDDDGKLFRFSEITAKKKPSDDQ